MKVEDVMTKNVITCSPEDTIRDVVRLMSEKDISGVPVVRDNKVTGIVTEGDIMRLLSVPEVSGNLWLPSPLEVILEVPFKELMQLRSLRKAYIDIGEKHVRDIMNENVISIAPDDDIEDAASLMVKYKIKRLPVIKDGSLVGIITRDDIIHGLGGTTHK